MLTLFRYMKAGRSRTYSLRRISDHNSELWVTAESVGRGSRQRKLMAFEREEDVEPVLTDVQRELRIGGWSEL